MKQLRGAEDFCALKTRQLNQRGMVHGSNAAELHSAALEGVHANPPATWISACLQQIIGGGGLEPQVTQQVRGG